MTDGGTRPWQGTIDAILYTLIFTRRLDDDAEVDRVAGMIRTERGLTKGTAAYREAITQALATGGPLQPSPTTGHSDADIRVFLTRLRERL